MKIHKLLLVTVSALLSVNSVYSMYASKADVNKLWVEKEEQVIHSKVGNINIAALHTALTAYANAQRLGYEHKPYLTIIDYSKPSTKRRLWVINLKTSEALFNTYVAHGKNSGGVEATSFSNRPGSLKTSIGVFETADTYYGKNGLSLRLRGLEHGFNDNALSRDIVMHGARYATAGGHSWGCPAINPRLARPIINTIKGNTILVAYYPDHKWLSRSQFLA